MVTGKTPGDFSLALLGDTFDKGNNADDNYKTMSADDYLVTVEDSPKALVADEWVGYGDQIDYRGLLFEYAGEYTFSFTATDTAKLTVWTVKEDGSLKAVKSVSVKAGEEKGISGLLLDSGLYYISVESTNAKKGRQRGLQRQPYRRQRFLYQGRQLRRYVGGIGRIDCSQ